jgi:hypothetical protein
MNIVLDFDGTCVAHVNPGIGEDIGAEPVLRELVEAEHNLILFTMRASGEILQQAIDWFEDREIPLYGVQTNPDQKGWTDSPKAYGDVIIDDTAIGIPLKYDISLSSRPFVDWVELRKLLISHRIL